MSIPTWPTTLPQYPLVNGYTRRPISSRLDFGVDSGRPILVNRATAMPDEVNENYLLTEAQRNTLHTFWKTSLKRGVADFLKLEPETKLMKLYQMSGEPVYTRVGLYWEVKLSLRILP